MDRRERACTEEEKLRAAFDALQAGLWTAMPGIVQSFNPARLTAEVQPAIKGRVRDKAGNISFVDLPLLVDCPVHFPSGGGFTLTFPLAQGDECLVVFADRCIDAWWQSGGIQQPMELRMHDLSDGFVFAGFRSLPRALAGVSGTATQLRSDDGQTYVEVGPGKIQLVADEVVIHSRNKATFDAGGTGFVYTPSQIDTYTNGVNTFGHLPNPPEVPT